MSIVSYDKFLDEVMPEVPGVTLAQAKAAIRNSAIEFCKRSWCWNMEIDAFDLEANVADYDLESPANNSVISAIMVLYYKGKQIDATARGELEKLHTNYRTVIGNPRNYLRNTPDTISFYPVPAADEAGAIRGNVALSPTRTSTGVERFIFENWLEQIAHGAKARLFVMNNVPWRNPQHGAFHQAAFDSACASVKLGVQKGLSRSRMRTKAHFF
jgi:hypothetical protein